MKSKPLTRKKINRFRTYIRVRNTLQNLIQKPLSGIKAYDQLFVIAMAVLIGISGGYLSVGFRSLIDIFRNILWHDVLSDLISPVMVSILVPALGIAAVAAFVKRFAPEAKGHGVPEVMAAVATRNGLIRMRVVIIKALASAFSIASGAAVGREGPIVQIGSAFGSTMGQLFQVSQRRMKTFIGCGTAAGIAATFNAPIAGAIFASEVVLGDFSAAAVGPVIISSVFATVISRGVYGNFPAFIPPVYELNSPYEIIFYAVLGIITGAAGLLFIRALYFSEDVFDGLSLPVSVKGLIGGLVMGGFAVFIPQVMGVGYESMDQILADEMPFVLAGVLLAGKMIATSVSLGAGASGGVFAPSLFMGAMLGGLTGSLFHSLYPDVAAAPGAYALVGMAAMVAATTHAPVTAILIIFELTSEYTIILPLMVSSIVAMVISSRFTDGNIYTLKLKRRGLDIESGTELNILNRLEISSLMTDSVHTLPEDSNVNELLERMSGSDDLILYVVNSDGILTGLITQGMMRRFIWRLEDFPANAGVNDIARQQYPSAMPDTPIPVVLKAMLEHDMMGIPVVDEHNRLLGQVMRKDILFEYQELINQTQVTQQLASNLKFARRSRSDIIEVIPGYEIAEIEIPSRFVGLTIQEFNRISRGQINILLVQKRDSNGVTSQIPRTGMVIRAEHRLIVFGEHSSIAELTQLI